MDKYKLFQLIKEVESTNEKKPFIIGTDKSINTLKTFDWFQEIEKYADIKIMSNSFSSDFIADDKIYIIPNTSVNISITSLKSII